MDPIGSAKAVILRSDKKMLVLRRSQTHPSDAGQPDLPGGVIEPGEEPLDTLIREIKEETGVVVNSDSIKLVYENTSTKDDSFIRHLYLIKFDKEPKIKLSWEHDKYEWMEVEHLAKIEEKYLPFYAQALHYLTSNDLL